MRGRLAFIRTNLSQNFGKKDCCNIFIAFGTISIFLFSHARIFQLKHVLQYKKGLFPKEKCLKSVLGPKVFNKFPSCKVGITKHLQILHHLAISIAWAEYICYWLCFYERFSISFMTLNKNSTYNEKKKQLSKQVLCV